MDKNTFFSLLERYQDGNASPAEAKLAEEYYRRLEAIGSTQLTVEEERELKEKLFGLIIEEIKRPVIRPVFNWRRIAIAASLVLTIGISSYLLFFKKQVSGIKHPVTSDRLTDLPPGRDAAILTLADGRQLFLDSTSGTIAQQNGVTVINLAGQLSYQQQETSNRQPAYNIVTTARGNQYQLILADGSKVWLNSASSLRFPTAFTGDDREVELTGEGYFEVAHNPSKPFKVRTDKQIVEVLGTHFNINSYTDEDATRTTLLEGSVKVSGIRYPASGILKLGQQAIIQHSTFNIQNDVDLEKVMAWKNGWFEFDQMDLGAIMRQVSRWYDVDITYDGKLTGEKFGGRLSKTLPLSAVIEMMKASGVECKLVGKTLYVKP